MISLSKIEEEFMPQGNGISEKPPKEDKPEIKYIYDDVWLKKVFKGICPECDDGLLIKKGIVRFCSEHEHLRIYGNPVLVAYKKIIKNKPEPAKSYGVCPEPGCKCTDFDYNMKTDETTCKKCGIVLSGPPDARVKYPWHISYSDFVPRKFKF